MSAELVDRMEKIVSRMEKATFKLENFTFETGMFICYDLTNDFFYLIKLV